MKTTDNLRAVGLMLLLSIINPCGSISFAQGTLIPPGAPAPTMKSLDQLEARTPISTVPFTISNSGSYYLTKNLNVTTGDALTISTNQVTLDLNGFTISSTASSATGSGILLGSGLTDIAIFNGHIKGGVTNNAGVYLGGGFMNGIYFIGVPPWNVQVRVVSVSGCLNSGIYIGLVSQVTLVESCVVRTLGGTGIFASSVSHCTARDCGDTGIVADTASDCSAYTANGPGISAGTAVNCYGQSLSGQGITGGSASNCRGFSSSSQGISAETASNCYGYSSSNRGIFANVASACSGRCDGGSYGLFATSVASACYGYSFTGTGLNAYIAIGCTGSSLAYTYHYNMPP